MAKLTVKKVEALIKSGDGKTQRHADGEGLYLVVPASGTASWMLRFSSNKKRREMTLGKVRALSLVNDLFEDWYPTLVKRLKHPNIPKRVYTKDIAPHIGDIPLDKITARDIRTAITAINDSGRPTIVNDA